MHQSRVFGLNSSKYQKNTRTNLLFWSRLSSLYLSRSFVSSRKGSENPDRVRLLRKEISKLVNIAVKGITLKCTFGKESKNDIDDYFSDDSDEDSLDLGTGTYASGGIMIPAERRMIMVQLMKRMAALSEEKKHTMGFLVDKWRVSTSNELRRNKDKYNSASIILSLLVEKLMQLRSGFALNRVKINFLASLKTPGNEETDLDGRLVFSYSGI